jgi:hypothetical protein
MLVTITNTSGAAINKLDSYADAVGGARTNPLPYPFSHIGELAAAASKQLPMSPADLFHKVSFGEPFQAWNEIQTLIKRGVISAAIADQAALSPYGSFDERFMIEVG